MRGSPLIVVLALAGCAPATTIRGRVADGDAPVEGARVAVRCPGEPGHRYLATADADGRFSIEGDGVLHPACAIHVDKPGYDPAIFALSSLCAISGNVWEGCYAASVQAQLIATPVDAPEEPAAGKGGNGTVATP